MSLSLSLQTTNRGGSVSNHGKHLYRNAIIRIFIVTQVSYGSNTLLAQQHTQLLEGNQFLGSVLNYVTELIA